ncbi:MAG: sulfite exporter TauE/SafE family protein [Clostridiales bacterium]|nr:sulfite exporter TauE/SafE family protein [Clostridiales bacterium]
MSTIFKTTLGGVLAGAGAGIGTGFAGMSAATVISPMLATFLGMPTYEAVGIALASDVLASGMSAYTYGKNKNINIRDSVLMMIFVLGFTIIGSKVSSTVENGTMSLFSICMTLFLGVQFLVKPNNDTTKLQQLIPDQKKNLQVMAAGGIVGFICGFLGAGGGMMMLFVLTIIMGYELKVAVGTSVFIMTFTAFTGSVSHFIIQPPENMLPLVLCIIFTFFFAQQSAKLANKIPDGALHRVTGMILLLIAVIIIQTNYLTI